MPSDENIKNYDDEWLSKISLILTSNRHFNKQSQVSDCWVPVEVCGFFDQILYEKCYNLFKSKNSGSLKREVGFYLELLRIILAQCTLDDRTLFRTFLIDNIISTKNTSFFEWLLSLVDEEKLDWFLDYGDIYRNYPNNL